MRPTTIQERMDLMAEVADVKHGTIREWTNTWSAEGERLNGVPIRLRWYEDGTAVVEVDGVPSLRVSVEITVHPVEFENEENRPTGFILRRTWATVPAGWFVQTPKGQWLEVTSTYRIPENPEGDRQMVSLFINGKVAAFPRDPDQEVKARRGTLAPRDRDDALDLRGDAFKATIIEDEGPMQS